MRHNEHSFRFLSSCGSCVGIIYDLYRNIAVLLEKLKYSFIVLILMWTAKLSSTDDKGFLRKYAVGHNVSITGYPIASYQSGKFIRTTIAGTVHGEEKNKRNCLLQLSKEKALVYFESKDDFFIASYLEPLSSIALYSSFIIYLKPIILSPNGEYVMEIGSSQKEKIQKFISLLEKERKMKLLRFKNEKIGTISVIGLSPELTKKQKTALELAIKLGYYGYPRKIDLEKLSKQMHVSLSTFRQHLRIAENKFLKNAM
jgi:predicted DNA binding protein